MARIAVVQAGPSATGSLPVRPFQRSTDSLAEWLAAYGHDVDQILLDRPSGTDGPGRAAAAATRLDLTGYDVVHGVGRRVAAVLAHCMIGRTWVWSAEYDEDGAEQAPPADLVISPTRAVASRLAVPRGSVHRVIPERLSRVVGAQDIPTVPDRATLAVTVLSGGDPEGVGDAVRCLSLTPWLRLLVLADPLDRTLVARVDRLARGLHVRDRLDWYLGRDVDVVRDAMAVAHLYLDLSRTRIDPAAAVAAMAAGVPVVLSAASGADELVQSGASGLIVPVGDPHRASIPLRVMVDEPRLRADSALAARAMVRERLHPARTTEEVLRAYSGLVPAVKDPGDVWAQVRSARHRKGHGATHQHRHGVRPRAPHEVSA